MSKGILADVINDIFVQERAALRAEYGFSKSKTTTRKQKRDDIEFAVAVMLVDLASCDQHFDQVEYDTITAGLSRVFGLNQIEVTGLIQRANIAIQGLRGTDNFAKLIRESLPQEKREDVMKLIDELIAADGVLDGFELLLRRRYAQLLGIGV